MASSEVQLCINSKGWIRQLSKGWINLFGRCGWWGGSALEVGCVILQLCPHWSLISCVLPCVWSGVTHDYFRSELNHSESHLIVVFSSVHQLVPHSVPYFMRSSLPSAGLVPCPSASAFLFPCPYRVCPLLARCVGVGVGVCSVPLLCVPLLGSRLSNPSSHFHSHLIFIPLFILIFTSFARTPPCPRPGVCVCACVPSEQT